MMQASQLAIEGGAPVRKTAYAPWPHFEEDEIAATAEVLRSGRVNYWTSDTVQRFETAFADYVGARFAIALANGTLALELALRGLGIGTGDEVIVPSRTFVATASAAVAVGAQPIVADVDPVHGNLTAEMAEAVWTPRTRAIVPVHLAGHPCEMDAIMDLARRRDAFVIEDCAQAHGAEYKGRKVGTIGHAGAFSFCQDKIMTTGGEGGMLVTDDEALWRRAWAYKDHGKDHDTVFRKDHPPGFRWLHDTFGSNWRLTAMQAAIGLRQLEKLPAWLERRHRNARTLADRLAKEPALSVPLPPRHVKHAYYKFYVQVKPEALVEGWDRQRLMEAITAEGVPCFSGSCSEIYLERAFQDAGLAPPGRHPNAQQIGETSLMFLVHPTLGTSDMDDAALAVRKVLEVAAQ